MSSMRSSGVPSSTWGQVVSHSSQILTGSCQVIRPALGLSSIPSKRAPMDTCPSPDLNELVARGTRRWRGGRRERPFRFLLDGRLFRLLCEPAALDRFRAAVAHLRLAPAGGLPDLEMTPLAVLDVMGVEPPRLPPLPSLPENFITLEEDVEFVILIKDLMQKEFQQAPELDPENLVWRVEALRDATAPVAHGLFDLCLTRFVCRDTFFEEILEQLAFDGLFTLRFPVEFRERMSHLFNSLLVANEVPVSGLTKVRRLKGFWDKSLERILKKHSRARGEILAVDQEMRPRTYGDFLGWEVIHHAVLGYGGKRLQPVIAFSPEPEERLRARCRAHKTALRAFLDELDPKEIRTSLQPLLRAWTPGWLVSCRRDGTVEGVISTGEVGVWAGGRSPAVPQAASDDTGSSRTRGSTVPRRDVG